MPVPVVETSRIDGEEAGDLLHVAIPRRIVQGHRFHRRWCPSIPPHPLDLLPRRSCSALTEISSALPRKCVPLAKSSDKSFPLCSQTKSNRPELNPGINQMSEKIEKHLRSYYHRQHVPTITPSLLLYSQDLPRRFRNHLSLFINKNRQIQPDVASMKEQE